MSTEKSLMAETIEWHNIRTKEVALETEKAQRSFDRDLRKWALEFLAGLNPGKPFEGDIFDDADAIVAYVTRGRQPPKVDVAQAFSDAVAQRSPQSDPFDVNTGLAQ